MIKKSAINRILADRIEKNIVPFLLNLGYKHSKTSKRFTQTNGELKKEISYWLPNFPIEFNEGTPMFFIKFLTKIEFPKFDKWFTKTTGNQIRTTYYVRNNLGFSELSQIDFTEDDFYELTELQRFKHQKIKELEGSQSNSNSSTSFQLIINRF